MDEARILIRRLERIDVLKREAAPTEELLGEVRQLLAEGEAWLAAERTGSGRRNGNDPLDSAIEPAARAAAALECCRTTLARRNGVAPKTADATSL